MVADKVFFNSPYFAGNEQKYLLDSFQSGFVAGDRKYTKLVQEFFKNNFAIDNILLTTSGSTALDMSAILLNLQAGDEVIMPSYTFVSTANAVLMRGAKSVFVEIDETMNIDVSKIEEKITKKTKAIYPVHYAGCSCDMDSLLALAKKYHLFVVEDAAQAVNAKYKNSYLGTLGDLGAYSFHETKNFTCGEGGALVVNNHDYLERAEIIREKGTDRTKFYRGFIDKYTWCDIGGSYLPSDLLSAILLAQLEQKDTITEKRKAVWQRYQCNLSALEQKGVLAMMKIPDYNTPNYHIFYILLPNRKERDLLLSYLKSEKIGAVFHYIPLHTSKMGRQLGYKKEDFPLSVNLSERIIRLPLFAGLELDQVDYICEKIKFFIGEKKMKKEQNTSELNNIYIYKQKKFHYDENTKEIIKSRIKEETDFPTTILIDTISFCNLKCIMCVHKNMKRKYGIMEWDLYKKIIDEIAENNPNTQIWITFFGEGLMLKDLPERIAYAREQGLTNILLNTNGNLLKTDFSKRLIEAGLNGLYVGIDAYHPETYAKIRVNGKLENVVKGVLEYKELLKQYGRDDQTLMVQFVEMDINAHEMNDFVNFWHNVHGIKCKIRPMCSWAGKIEGLTSTIDIPERISCFRGINSLSITNTGNVAVCPGDLECLAPMGNVAESSIKEIWNTTLKEFRTNQREGNWDKLPELCKGCKDYFLVNAEYVG